MAKKIKFALEMEDGVQVRTLDDLKEHFDIKKVAGYFLDGRLLTWLQARYYDDEAEQVKNLSPNDPDLNQKLCGIFGVESEDEDFNAEEIAQRTERLNKLKQYTDDKDILERIDQVAFDQEELSDLLDEEKTLIYLCNNQFVIPLRETDKTYIGIGKAIAVIRTKKIVDFEKLNIHFRSIRFDDNYERIVDRNQEILKENVNKDYSKTTNEETKPIIKENIVLYSPIIGTLVPITECSDPVFAGGAMGRGIAVKNPQGKVYAPFDGEMNLLFDTHHAIGLHSNNGIDLLIHVGVDTVTLRGKYFTPKARQGDKIRKGQLLLEFDPKGIKSANLDTTTPVVVLNHENFGDITFELNEQIITLKDPNDNLTDSNDIDFNNLNLLKDMESQYNYLSDEKRVAFLISFFVGGMDNVQSFEKCTTRLRLIVKDKLQIEDKCIENINGVKGQFFAAQKYQIILGRDFVDKVEHEFNKWHKLHSLGVSVTEYLNESNGKVDNNNANVNVNDNKKDDGFCFITTAVCDSFNKPDNCYELTMFRNFRDNWLVKQPDGKVLIDEYYEIAPAIVKSINHLNKAKQIYESIWQTYLKPCLSFIEIGDNNKCKLLYVDMVNDLRNKYLN